MEGMTDGRLGWFDWALIAGASLCSIIYAALSAGDQEGFDLLGVAAAVTGVLSVVLTAHRLRINYVFGLVNVLLYAWISYKACLLGDCLLYVVYYLPMQIVGWISWSRHSVRDDRTTVRPEPMGRRRRLAVAAASIAAVILFGMALSWLKAHAQDCPAIERWHIFSQYPYRDSLTTVFAVTAQYLMVKAHAEQWLYWLAIDVVSIVIWCCFLLSGTEHAGLMVIMYVFYLANCINGMRIWKRHSEKS